MICGRFFEAARGQVYSVFPGRRLGAREARPLEGREAAIARPGAPGAHSTHGLNVIRGVLHCRVCGRPMTQNSRLLAEACPPSGRPTR
eukprot:5324544-Pyramimonas_sp.AAC.1